MRPAVRYAVSIAVMMLFLALRFALIPWLGLTVPYLQFFPALMVTAFVCGRGPAFLVVALATLAADLFFL